MTIASQQPINKLTDQLREQIAQAGFTEALTFRYVLEYIFRLFKEIYCKYYQQQTKHSLFRGVFFGQFGVPLFNGGTRKVKRTSIFIIFTIFFSILDIFCHFSALCCCFLYAFYLLRGGKVLNLESLPTLLYYNTESRISAYFRKTQEKS